VSVPKHVENASGSKTKFNKKSSSQKRAINEALELLRLFGIPLSGLTSTRLEAMGLAFLAMAGLDKPGRWSKCADVRSRALTTREIIGWKNSNFGEKGSMGSYDDIRRRDLLYPNLAGVAAQPKSSGKNDPTRGWGVAAEVAEIVRCFPGKKFDALLAQWMKGRVPLDVKLAKPRDISEHAVALPGGVVLELEGGSHNELIKAVIEVFLPIYGHEAEVLYVGDAGSRMLHFDAVRLEELGVFGLDNGDLLPDVVAYSRGKGWLFFIEAVHSVGPVSSEKHLQFETLMRTCKVPVVYVTAFENKSKFAKFADDIAWETEVWIWSDSTHMIHFNGDKFLGPYVT